MTEKQLRERLTEYLSPADLQGSRKEALLKQIRQEAPPAPEKGETNMFRPNKFRTALVLAAILTLLSFTVALAAGMGGYVNFKGERVDDLLMPQPTPMSTQEPEPTDLTDEAFTAILNGVMNTSLDRLVVVSYDDGHGGGKGGSRDVEVLASTLDEMTSLLGDTMPLPRIPEGFSFIYGDVSFCCDADSAYELVSEEVTPEGVSIRHYAIPEGEAVPSNYSLSLANDAGDRIYCRVQLGFSNSGHHFGVNEEDIVQTPAVPGMDDALLIIRPDNTRLAMRHTLDEPVTLWSCHPGTWERYPTETYDMMEYHIDSDTVPADVLLSIYAK